MYDVIFVGGGISCLYAAFKLYHQKPTIKVCILEANSHLGGRIQTSVWQGARIVHGAGVLRWNKDKLLKKLLQDLDLNAHPYESKVHYAIQNPSHISDVVSKLRRSYRKKQHMEGDTFRDFGIRILGKEAYERFVITCGYTDFENEDVYEALFQYGLEDTLGGMVGAMPWNDVIYSLSKYCVEHGATISTNSRVTSITRNGVMIQGGHHIAAKTIVVGVPICQWKGILGERASMYDSLQSQPFLRIYAKVSVASNDILNNQVPGYTVVQPPLQKIIPISREQRVYMVAYSDNAHARRLQHASKKEIAVHVEKALHLPANSIHIQAMKKFFWEEGTHYFSPTTNIARVLRKMQHPVKHVFVIGEAFSRNQGWTEGALESVERVLPLISSAIP